jgi:hypothetical protein
MLQGRAALGYGRRALHIGPESATSRWSRASTIELVADAAQANGC